MTALTLYNWDSVFSTAEHDCLLKIDKECETNDLNKTIAMVECALKHLTAQYQYPDKVLTSHIPLSHLKYFLTISLNQNPNSPEELVHSAFHLFRIIDNLAWRNFSRNTGGSIIVKLGEQKHRIYEPDGTYYSIRTTGFKKNGRKKRVYLNEKKQIFVATKTQNKQGIDEKTSLAVMTNIPVSGNQLNGDKFVSLENEARVLSQYRDNPHFVKFDNFFTFKIDNNNYCFLFEEYCNLGDLGRFTYYKPNVDRD